MTTGNSATRGRVPQGCIPALDDPGVTDAEGGSWYPDDGIVFAVVIGDEARAYPRHIMEIHEMVNDSLGGRRIGMPYCTLCGSAQAYFTDEVTDGVEMPVLRTSGLLSRSNKVMYDLVTKSVFDTFTGHAVSGPLRQQGVVLSQATVVTTTWGDWKAAHPDTTIVARGGGIGRVYPLNPLGGRDDHGPIFPVGDVDERLGVQEQVFGVVLGDGTPVAFPVEAAAAALRAGEVVELSGGGAPLGRGRGARRRRQRRRDHGSPGVLVCLEPIHGRHPPVEAVKGQVFSEVGGKLAVPTTRRGAWLRRTLPVGSRVDGGADDVAAGRL